jgi:hypothetical protein
MNAPALDQVHIDAQHIVKVREESAKIEQPPALTQIHQEVDIALRRFSPVATEPNTRIFRQPCTSALCRISARFSRRSVSSVSISLYLVYLRRPWPPPPNT